MLLVMATSKKTMSTAQQPGPGLTFFELKGYLIDVGVLQLILLHLGPLRVASWVL